MPTPDVNADDYYKVLGVERSATDAEFCLVHSPAHLAALEELPRPSGNLTSERFTCPHGHRHRSFTEKTHSKHLT